MNRKSIIQITVIVFCLGASGLVLYNGLFKDSSLSTMQSDEAVNITDDLLFVEPLPFGSDLSGELDRVLKKNALKHGDFVYPILKENEIGISVNNLIKPK